MPLIEDSSCIIFKTLKMLPIDDSLASLETGNNVYLHFNFRTGKFYSKIDASALPDSIIYQQLGLSQNQINKLKTNRIDHNANENYKNICAFPFYLSKNRVYVLIKYMHLESPISNGDTLYVNFRPSYFDVLLYLESRGLDEEEACNLMARAKLNALCSKIGDEELETLAKSCLEEVTGYANEKL